MKVFLDTSVLIAASWSEHPQFAGAKQLVGRVQSEELEGVICAHTLAELYAVLTRLPVRPAIGPEDALRIIEENVLPRFRVVELGVETYARVLRQAAGRGLRGGVTYDALLMDCARASGAERIYTLNWKDFRRVAPDLEDRIVGLE